ncbi:MAG: hypothetical protein AB8B58_04995 [Roseobacter sp.]
MTDIPEYFFRIRENGATVFRVDTENRHRRIEMLPIAVANTRNGDIKPHGKSELNDTDRAEIKRWIEARQQVLAGRDLDSIQRTIEHLNLTAQWAQSKATADQLESVTDDLLMAMHDLRSVLVSKKADRLRQDE